MEAPHAGHAPAEPEAPAEEHEYAEQGYDAQEFDDRFAEEDHQYGEEEYPQQAEHAGVANGSSPEPGRVPDLEETAEYVPDQPIGQEQQPPRDGEPFPRREEEHAFQPGAAAEEPAGHREDEPSHAFDSGPAGQDDEAGHAFDTGEADAFQPGQQPHHDDDPSHAAFQPPRHDEEHAFQAPSQNDEAAQAFQPGQPPHHDEEHAFQAPGQNDEPAHAFQPGQQPHHDDAPSHAAFQPPRHDEEHAFQPGQPPRHEDEQAFQAPGRPAPAEDAAPFQPPRREPAFDPGPPTMITQPEVPGVLPVPEPAAPQPAAQAEPPAPPRPGRRALRRETPDHPVLAGLQAKLDELDVPESSYKLGEPAEHGWSVEEVDDGWRVGWYDGKLSNPAVFGDAEDAAAFMLGKLLLNPEGHLPAEEPPAPAPEPEPEPAPQRVVATLSPEVATGSYPVRKPEPPVPPQEQTAFTSAEELFGDLEDDEPPAPPRQPAPVPAGPPPLAQQAGP
ncbi:hypothetical protein ACHL6L_44355, partial [Amycolatopsis sp. A24]